MREKSKSSSNLLLLFGSRATGEATTDSDYDLLKVVHVEPERSEQELPAHIAGMKHVSLDELPYHVVKEGITIGTPEILIIFAHCQVLEGHDTFQQLLRLDQGITALSVSLSIQKAQKTLSFCEELLHDKLGRMAAHQLSVAWFWVLAAAQFAAGMIPPSKRKLFHYGEVKFIIPEQKMLEYASYASADLYEPPHDEVLRYLLEMKKILKDVVETTYEDYLEKAQTFLEKTRDLYSRGDYDLTILAAHATIELIVKGFLLNRIQKLPLYLLQALDDNEFYAELETSLTEEHVLQLREVNKKRNQVYHTTYLATKTDARSAITLAETLLTLLSS